MDEDEDVVLSQPTMLNTFAIPKEHSLELCFDLYTPSKQSLALKSEQGRHIFAELFVINSQLDTLANLAVRALAQGFGAAPLPIIAEDPLKLRVHYDSLDVNLPLNDIYFVEDEVFWRRVVLAKTRDPWLKLKKVKDLNWKNLGVSLKFVEIAEKCPAEYWPEQEMRSLAEKIKPWVLDLDIRKLQSLQEHTFAEIYGAASETDSSIGDEVSITSSSEEYSESESEDLPMEEEDYMGEEEENEEMALYWQERRERAQLRAARKQEIEERKAMRQRKHEERMKRRQRREQKIARRAAQTGVALPKKKRKKFKGVFDILLSDEEPDLIDQTANVADWRNVDKLLASKVAFEYLDEHCHHIDLSFVRYFENLQSLSLEFQGPDVGRDFHCKHWKFSYDDMTRLANGLGNLPNLMVFRLRNSTMDTRKLDILVKTLKRLDTLQTLDFSNDLLNDECAPLFKELLRQTTSITELELQSNQFGSEVLKALAEALKRYKGQMEYIGLNNNPVGDEGLQALSSALVETGQQVTRLDLRGINVSQEAIASGIANELIRQHKPLINLDLSGVHLDWLASVEIVKALGTNKHILRLHIRNCNLHADIEYEIEMLLKRNRYIAENPYVGNTDMSDEEVDAWVNRTKHKVLLEAMDAAKKQLECLENRPDEFEPSIAEGRSEEEEDGGEKKMEAVTRAYQEFEDYLLEKPKLLQIAECGFPEVLSQTTIYDRSSSSNVTAETDLFEYKPNDFDMDDFLKHVHVAGPKNRYRYFAEAKLRERNKRLPPAVRDYVHIE